MTLTEKIERTRTDVAWLRDWALPVEQQAASPSSMAGLRWFESGNIVDLVALRQILRNGDDAV
jgi:hypothetical protein